MKLKVTIILAIIFIFPMCLIGYFLYKSGFNSAQKNCMEKDIEAKTETVEVIKYIYKDDAKIYIRPNSSLDELIKRMEKGEI